MNAPIFESKDMQIKCRAKRSIGGAWINFLWEPSLSMNGETCMTTSLVTYNEDGSVGDMGNQNAVVERIRLSGIATSLKHYASVEVDK